VGLVDPVVVSSFGRACDRGGHPATRRGRQRECRLPQAPARCATPPAVLSAKVRWRMRAGGGGPGSASPAK